MRHSPSLAGLVLGLSLALPAAGQDVELLGEIYGTRPPDAYFEQMRRDPDSYRFSGEGIDRLRRLRESPILRSLAPPSPGGIGALSIGPRDGPVMGTFRFPLVLGLVNDGPSPPPFSAERVQQEYFDGPNSYPGSQTVAEFYNEMSLGVFEFRGETHPWVSTGMTQEEVTLGENGIRSHPTLGVGTFIERILDALDDGSIDWSEYDMSGDGYVDVLAVMHPFRGGECTARETDLPAGYVWSHRWSLIDVTGGLGVSRFSSNVTGKVRHGYETSTPHPGGGNVHINNYTIQAVLSCSTGDPPLSPYEINQIGVFSHELGHALGLPDLYNTADNKIPGVGNWDLMGTGAWGCRLTNDAQRPCHMGAWSKAALGWLTVDEVGADELHDITLEPVQTSGRILRVPASDGSGEYLLLENRQRMGSDVNLVEPGLLVWQINPTVVDLRWTTNRVNAFPSQMGVRLRQADGLNHLGTSGGNRGDAGDPFPGCSGPFQPCTANRAFHVGTDPAAVTLAGAAMGISLTEIALAGSDPYNVTFTLDTHFERGMLAFERTVEAAKPASVGFEVAGVPPESITWRLVGGTLPVGIGFDPVTASLEGLTLYTGTYQFVLGAASAVGQETEVAVTLEVVPPVLAQDDLVSWFVRGVNPLSTAVRDYLDLYGNQNINFDLGDVRAYLQANPDAPATTTTGSQPSPVVVDPWVGGGLRTWGGP